jgi:plastocyanin
MGDMQGDHVSRRVTRQAARVAGLALRASTVRWQPLARRMLHTTAALSLVTGLVFGLGGTPASAAARRSASGLAPSSATRPGPSCNPEWRITPSPSTLTGNSILFGTAATSSTDAWTVGYFDDGSSFRTLTEHWNGTAWSIVPSPVVGEGYDILGSVAALGPDDVWAVGSHQPLTGTAEPLAMHWDGSTWRLAKTPSPGSDDSRLLGVATYDSNDVWAVGTATGSTQRALVLHWDGQAWNSAALPRLDGAATLRDVAVESPNDAWAVGTLVANDGGHDSTPLILHWDGFTWNQVIAPTIAGSSSLSGVSATSGADAWAVGQIGVGATSTTPFALHWDGRAWSEVATSEPPSSSAELVAVASSGASDVWAVGSYVGPGGVKHLTLIEHWDGAKWQTVTSADAKAHQFNTLTDVTSIPGSGLWAAGYYAGSTVDRTIAERLCPTVIRDAGFVPASARASAGQSVVWRIEDASAQHRIVDGTGLGLFDSGDLSLGQTFTYAFAMAGTYTTLDADTGWTGSVSVDMGATRSHQDPSVWSVTWASATVPAGYAIDVQIQRPGSPGFEPWMTSQTVGATSFAPDAGSGTYLFRSKVTSLATGHTSDWSPTLTISVP